MYPSFNNSIWKFVTINDEELADIADYFTLHTLKKKENLLKEGQSFKI
jgi:hypothetical protein